MPPSNADPRSGLRFSRNVSGWNYDPAELPRPFLGCIHSLQDADEKPNTIFEHLSFCLVVISHLTHQTPYVYTVGFIF